MHGDPDHIESLWARRQCGPMQSPLQAMANKRMGILMKPRFVISIAVAIACPWVASCPAQSVQANAVHAGGASTAHGSKVGRKAPPHGSPLDLSLGRRQSSTSISTLGYHPPMIDPLYKPGRLDAGLPAGSTYLRPSLPLFAPAGPTGLARASRAALDFAARAVLSIAEYRRGNTAWQPASPTPIYIAGDISTARAAAASSCQASEPGVAGASCLGYLQPVWPP